MPALMAWCGVRIVVLAAIEWRIVDVLQASLEAMATQKAARERHMALQQQQHQQQQLLMQVMQSLPPQQRAQMQLLPQQQQVRCPQPRFGVDH